MKTNRTKVVPATQELINKLKGNLRKEDNRECLAMSGCSADISIQRGFERSMFCWVGMYDDEPVCVFGVVATSSVLRYKGIPWMLGTDAVPKVKMQVLRRSRKYVEKMLEPFQVLENWVDKRNTASKRWLKWCGFTIEKAEVFGMKGELFHRFWMKKEVS